MNELIEEQVKSDLANKKVELERAVKNLEEHQLVLGYMEEIAELLKEGAEKFTTPEMVRKLEPVYGFDTSDEYWELQSRLMKLQQTQRYFTLKDKEIEQLKKVIEQKTRGIDDLKARIAEMEGDD